MPSERGAAGSKRSLLGLVLDRDSFLLAAVWVWTGVLTALRLPLGRLGLPLHEAWKRAGRKKTQLWYQKVTEFLADSQVRFLNYGYVSLHPEEIPKLRAEDEAERYPLQLYHHVLSALDVKGLDVLEVSCGHGGGASFIMRYLGPRTMHGTDLNRRAVRFCSHTYDIEGLSFSQGDAEHLPFAKETFDVVVNVEASHCYTDMERFLSEVVRVLRPGGHFLFADLRLSAGARPESAQFGGLWPEKFQQPAEALDEQLSRSGLELVRRQDIMANILRASDLDSARRYALVKRLTPRPFHGAAKSFAVVEGSATRTALASGEWSYLSYALRKPTRTAEEGPGP